MPKGYLIAHVTVSDADAYGAYAKAASQLLKESGARLVVRPDTATIVEGTPKARTMIFEFESLDKVKAFWESPAYGEAKLLRAGAAEADFIIIEGVD